MLFEKPYFLWGILLIVPVTIFVYQRFKALARSFGFANAKEKRSANSSVKTRFILRMFCFALAFVCVCIALAKPFWGSEQVPVKKRGSSVVFVFDVSYSMLAKDMPNAQSRLSASSNFAKQVLTRLDGASVAVVLNKGMSVLSIPLTEDFALIQSLLDALSPSLLTAAGSDLGSGIRVATKAFAPQYDRHQTVLFFTDGDETLGNMTEPLLDAIQRGINVVLVGMGSTQETEIITGDGVQKVMTSLKEEKLIALCNDVAQKASQKYGSSAQKRISYVKATNPSAGASVLNACHLDSNDYATTSDEQFYETVPVCRYRIFVLAAFLFVVAGFVASELSIDKKNKTLPQKSTKSFFALIILCASTIFLQGCNNAAKSASTIFAGVIHFGQGNYQKAAGDFFVAQDFASTYNDVEAAAYAQFGLATTYLMQEEILSANNLLKKLEASDATPSAIRYKALYNAGIIAYNNADFALASDYFKKALLIQSDNINAKINLELSMAQMSVQAQRGEKEVSPIEDSASKARQDAVFSIIRENDKKQWKSQEQENTQAILDY